MKISSIFTTLDGEVTQGGPLQWSTFVRFGGCNLRCWKSTGFCDAPHTLEMGHESYRDMTPEEIFKEVECRGPKRVTITGGEPLLQPWKEMRLLCTLLQANNYQITVETGGGVRVRCGKNLHWWAIELSEYRVGRLITVVMDLKPPSTEMSKFMKLENLEYLHSWDYVKVVVEDLNDLEWTLKTIKEHPTEAKVAVGPRWGSIGPLFPPADIASWLRVNQLWTWQMNLQLHKYIWPECMTLPVAKLVDVDYPKMVSTEV